MWDTVKYDIDMRLRGRLCNTHSVVQEDRNHMQSVLENGTNDGYSNSGSNGVDVTFTTTDSSFSYSSTPSSSSSSSSNRPRKIALVCNDTCPHCCVPYTSIDLYEGVRHALRSIEKRVNANTMHNNHEHVRHEYENERRAQRRTDLPGHAAAMGVLNVWLRLLDIRRAVNAYNGNGNCVFLFHARNSFHAREQTVPRVVCNEQHARLRDNDCCLFHKRFIEFVERNFDYIY